MVEKSTFIQKNPINNLAMRLIERLRLLVVARNGMDARAECPLRQILNI